MKTIFLIMLSVLSLNIYAQKWETDFEVATNKAKETNKEILMVFSGSDWCFPCKKLKKEVFQTATFKKYAQENLILLNLDFPQRKANQLSKKQTKQNEKLADKYNSKGHFPKVVMLSKNLKILGMVGYNKMNAANYVKHLDKMKQ